MNDTPFKPALYLVATPIGNLEDITLRALRVLKSVDLIACEDTRHTQKLLNHFNIHVATISYHEHNEPARARDLIAQIATGKRVALVTDAGTPALSDPGYKVVQAAIAAGIPVVPIPGAAAAINALVASGLPTDAYYFAGFLPGRAGERRSALEFHRERKETMVFYEAPHRLLETLADVVELWGRERRVCVARELTKIHEELLRGTAAEVLAILRERREVRGEITLVLSGAPASLEQRPSNRTLAARMRELLASGEDEKSALKLAAKEFNLGKSEAYREWQRHKR